MTVQQTAIESITPDVSALFSRARYAPGTETGGGTYNAGICLVKPDPQIITGILVDANDLSPLGSLSSGIAKFVARLIQRGLAPKVALEGRDNILAVVLHLPDGESNPALGFLNRVRALYGAHPLNWLDVANEAGVDIGQMGRVTDLTPSSARLADKLEAMLLEVINTALIHAPRPSPTPR